jgi:hypothetical protein
MLKKSPIGIHVLLETVQAFKPRIDEIECHHRGQRRNGVIEHREFVHEKAIREAVLYGPGTSLGRKDFLADSELAAAVTQLLLLRFEVSVIVISADEVKDSEAAADVVGRVLTAVTGVVPTDGFIQIPREKVTDAALAQIFLRGGVLT